MLNKQQVTDYKKSTACLIASIRKEKARIIMQSEDRAIIAPIYQLVLKHGICTFEPDYEKFSDGYYDVQYNYEDREYTFTVYDGDLIGLVVKTKKEKE